MSTGTPVEKKIPPPSILTGTSTESLETCKDDKRIERKIGLFSHFFSKSSSAPRGLLVETKTTTNTTKRLKEVNVRRPVSTRFITALNLKNYCHQKHSQEYNCLLTRKIPIRSERLHVQMSTATFNPLDSIFER